MLCAASDHGQIYSPSQKKMIDLTLFTFDKSVLTLAHLYSQTAYKGFVCFDIFLTVKLAYNPWSVLLLKRKDLHKFWKSIIERAASGCSICFFQILQDEFSSLATSSLTKHFLNGLFCNVTWSLTIFQVLLAAYSGVF